MRGCEGIGLGESIDGFEGFFNGKTHVGEEVTKLTEGCTRGEGEWGTNERGEADENLT